MNKKAVTIGSILVFLLLAWGGYKIYQQHEQVIYWQNQNTPIIYSGDGYKIVFPCSDVKNTPLAADVDMISSFNSCEFFGGNDHLDIDTYSVFITHYLSNTYNINDEIKCSDYTDNETQITFHAIYHEKRTIDRANIYICGWDSKMLSAKVINNNTIYTIIVSPNDTTTTYAKLNDFLATFQFTENGNN